MTNKQIKPVVLIVCDAIRGDYLTPEESPFFLEIAGKGIFAKRLRPSLGFCERVEMFSGSYPTDHGYFTALTFDENKSDFKKISNIEFGFIKFLKILSSVAGSINPFFRKAFNYVIIDNGYLKKIRGISQPTYEIPLDLLRGISLTEDYIDMQHKNSLSVETIFDIMLDNGKKFLYDTFASLRIDVGYSDKRRIKKLFSKIDESDYHLNLLYLGSGDGIGHAHGPGSTQRKEMVKRLDSQIKEIVTFFTNKYENVDFLILGDHGMVDVEKYVNAQDIISSVAKNNNLKLGQDYLLFLDSTLIRIWGKNSEAKKVFEKMFEDDYELSTCGKILGDDDVKSYKLPKNIEYYGDIIWLANPGVVVYPDYFHISEKVKGMHGYDISIDQQKGFAILYSKNKMYGKIVEECELIDICPTLCDLLDIDYPKSNRGTSLVD